MERWIGKVAVVTGASSGIGAAVIKDLAKAKMITIGLARRLERIEELKNDLPDDVKQNLVARKCDVSSEEDIKNTFKWIEENYGGVDVLINNAGIVCPKAIVEEGNSDLINQTIDVNIKGPIFCTREAFRSMKTRDTPGHIININSVVGHKIMNFMENGVSVGAYPPSKHAITALTEVVRQELLMKQTKIKVTVSFIASIN